MNVNTQFKGHKRTKKIKTWIDQDVERLTSENHKPAILVKVRSAFPKRGFLFGLREPGVDAYKFYPTQKAAHQAWKDDWKLPKVEKEVSNVQEVRA